MGGDHGHDQVSGISNTVHEAEIMRFTGEVCVNGRSHLVSGLTLLNAGAVDWILEISRRWENEDRGNTSEFAELYPELSAVVHVVDS